MVIDQNMTDYMHGPIYILQTMHLRDEKFQRTISFCELFGNYLIYERISCYMTYENKVNEGTEFPHFFPNSLKYKFYNEIFQILIQQIFI